MLYNRIKGVNIYQVPAICLALTSYLKNGIKLNPRDQSSTSGSGIMKEPGNSLKQKTSLKWIQIAQNNHFKNWK